MKRTYSALIFLLCTFLISITWLTPLPIVGAQFNSSIGISSYGTISYSPTISPTPTPTLTPTPTATPKPTPTPTPSGNNIATIPAFWTTPYWGLGGDSYDTYPVTWQGQTCMKIARNPTYVSMAQSYGWYNGLNELDSNEFSVNVGDHVVYSLWVWTESSTIGDTGTGYSGFIMNLDAYGSGGRICELSEPNGTPDTAPGYYRLIVPWGSGAWVKVTIDMIVQPTYKYDGFGGSYSPNQAVVPTGLIACTAISGKFTDSIMTNEQASAYIYGTVLYINPTLS